MADESKLQIILEAVNETGSPFQDLNEAISTFQKSADELAKSIASSFEGINRSASETAAGISKDMESSTSSVDGFSKSFSKIAETSFTTREQLMKDFEEIKGSFGNASLGATEAANLTDSQLARIVGTAQNTSIEVVRSMDTIRSDMEKGVGQIGGLIAIQMLGQSMEELGKQGEHLFDFAIEQGGDFQQTMKNIQTVIAANNTTHEAWNQKLQESAGLTSELQQKALELGSRGAQSANEVGAAMDTMLRAGVDAKTVLNGAAESAQNVAIVTGDKLDESANLVTEIYHQFRESFAENGKSVQENMKETGNVLTGTLLSARINSQDFLDTLKYVGPVASQLGSDFLDTATSTAILAQNGIKGSQAGTTLKRALTNLLEPTKAGAAAMKELGLIQNGHNMIIDESTGKMKNLTQIQDILHKSMEGLTEAKKAQYIHDIFGQYAMAGTLVLANENSEAFSKLKEKIGGISAENAAASMLNTFSGHMAQLKAHVQTTAKEFGMAFLPVLEKLIPIGQKVLNWLQNLSPSTKELLMGILALGSGLAIVGGALATFAISAKFAAEGFKALKALMNIQSLLGPLITGFKEFATAVRSVGIAEAFMDAMNPVGWVILIGAAIAGIAVLIYTHWNQIKSFLSATWDFIKSTAASVWNGITAFFKKWGVDLLAAFVPAIGLPILIAQHWSQITQIADQIWNGLVNWIKNLWNGFSSWISGAAKAAMQVVVDAFNWLYDHNYYFKNLVDFIKKAWTTIQNDAAAIWNGIKQFFTGLWNVLKFLAETYWNLEMAFLRTIWNTLVSMAKAVWTPIVNFFSGIWNSISSTASSIWSAVRSTITGLWNGIVGDAKNIFNGLGSFFTGLWSQAYNWGGNLVHMVAQGIMNAASEVANAAKSVAGKIASFLGFHSPAKEGPGSEADVWMPNLFKMLTSQVQEQIPNMNAALSLAFHPSMTGVTNMTSYNTMAPVMSGSSSNSSGIVVNIGSISGNIARSEQELADTISTHIVNKMKSQGKLG